MRNIVIDQKGCKLVVERQTLMIQHEAFRQAVRLPLKQLQSITITTPVELSSQILTKLTEHDISLSVLPNQYNAGKSCFVHGGWHAGVVRRQMQYEIIRHQDVAYPWAVKLVKLKIFRHRQTLLAMYHRFVDGDDVCIDKVNFFNHLQKLQFLQHKLEKEEHDLSTGVLDKEKIDYDEKIAQLRGIEGFAASVFFTQYRLFFAQNLDFNDRNRRPPKDPVNVILSLSYTLLQGVYEQAVFAVGFDPYLGVLHEVSYGRQSLACDFAELNRPFIESWVCDLFAEGILTVEDFSFNADSARPCEFLKIGRNRFYQEWSKIKNNLQKQAYKQVWQWLKRIEQQFEPDKDGENIDNASFEHVSEWLV